MNSAVDKAIETAVEAQYGTISIRVVVLAKGIPTAKPDEAVADASADEALPEPDKRPISTFLEEPKRGKQCCVFLINGQRQHAWDNQFIIRDLDLKYLRNQTIVVVECDGLRPEALAELMQGSRHQFYEGKVYGAIARRVIATLKGDPDLRALEEEAEDEISSLQAADESVKSALDQLIESHHESASRINEGNQQSGEATVDAANSGSLLVDRSVVVEGTASTGAGANLPVLVVRPDMAAIRLRPNEQKRVTVSTRPESAWTSVGSQAVTFDPPLPELQVTRKAAVSGEELLLKFATPEDFDEEQLPIETTLQYTAVLQGLDDPRMVERRVVISKKKRGPIKPVVLKDDPTFVRVLSRQPIRLVVPGPDLHVKLRWDGKDELADPTTGSWAFRTRFESSSVEPKTFLTRPVNGRFELLVQATQGLTAGTKLKFDVEAVGPDKTLSTTFLVEVAEPPQPRREVKKLLSGAQRRPPYELKYVKRDDWQNQTNWGGGTWSEDDAGAFQLPSSKSPLTIFINQDMALLETYRAGLLARKLTEAVIKQRANRYTAHLAFHLYQMYETFEQARKKGTENPEPGEDQQRDEVRRVAKTLIRMAELGLS
jgi:hypothetical protein